MQKGQVNSFRYIIVLILLLTFRQISSAQNDPFVRIEIEAKSDEAKYRLVPCGESGAVFFYKTTVSQDDYKFWIYVLYDKLLQEKWKQDIPIFDNMNYADRLLIGNNLYCFFHDPEKKRSDEYNFQILKIDLSSGIYELFSGLLPETSTFVDFKVLNNQVLIGLNTDNDYCGVYRFNMETRETISIYEITDKKARFESFFVDESKNNFSVIFNVFESKSNYYFLIKEFNAVGDEISSLPIKPEPGKKFNTGKISTLSGNFKVVFGTYGVSKDVNIDSREYFTKEAAGFYTVNITNPDNLILRHQNFLDLENMTGYLKSKEYQQAKRKAERNDENKDKYSVTYDMLLHDIIERDSLFYFVGEAFYEHYHTVTNTYYDYYGRAVPVSYSVFDGYRYFNAFISCYDHKGNKLWDNGMEIFNIMTFDLEKRINVFFDGDDTVLAYNREGKISAKIINGSETVEGVEHYPLETTYGNDKLVSDTKSNMAHWYNNYFLAYGFQTIKNNSLIDNNKRTVFYINKLAFN